VKLSAAGEKRAGTAGDRAQHQVVDGRVMGVCDLLGLFEIGTHDQDTVLLADRSIERSARSPALVSQLYRLADKRASWGEGVPRVRFVHTSAQGGDSFVQCIEEQL
jgi:hypothetical protein